MKDDLISRQDAISEIDAWIQLATDNEADMAIKEFLSFLKERIESLPSAEPKTGRWIKATGMMPPEFHGHHCCSECGNFANMEPPFGNREDLGRFCPNCGADMRGEK